MASASSAKPSRIKVREHRERLREQGLRPIQTARQAEYDVSIRDQKRQGESYCQSRGYQLAETYVEPGERGEGTALRLTQKTYRTEETRSAASAPPARALRPILSNWPPCACARQSAR